MDKEAVKGLIQRTGVIYHLAGIASVSKSIENPSSAYHTNTLGTLNLLEALRTDKHTDCLVIYLSSDRVYGDTRSESVTETDATLPIEPYAASKLSSEHLIQAYSRAYSIPFVILRGANVYGPGQRAELLIPSVIRQMVSGGKNIRVGNVEAYRNFVYVDDLIEALNLALKCSSARNEVFNIAGEGAKVREVIDILIKLGAERLGRECEVVVDSSLRRSSAVEGGRYSLDCNKASKVLGWQANFSLEEGLQETLESFILGD